MNLSGFTAEALDAVEQMLYAEDPYEGKCGQKKLREQNKQPRSQAEEAADQARSQKLSGKGVGGGANRSAAAKKAAETRKKCRGTTGPAAPPTP
jgi:hypothetical protein